MKETELMIGNLFVCEEQTLTVNGISQGFNDEPFTIEGRTKDDMFIPEIHLDDCHKIKLTEEWLKKFGFDDAGYKPGYIGKEFKSNMILDFVLTKPGKLGDHQTEYVFELQNHRIVSIEWVHSLQNFYKAITGKTLKLKQ